MSKSDASPRADAEEKASHPPSEGSVDSTNTVDESKDVPNGKSRSGSDCTWTTGVKLLKLPPPPPAAMPVICTKGWPSYLTSRWSGDATIIQRVQADPCVLGGLTYPVTLAFLLASLRFSVLGELTVVVLGALAHVEERLLRETSHWGEISVCLRCRVHIVLCGPEVSETSFSGDRGAVIPPNSDTRASLFSGAFAELRRRHSAMLSGSTVLVAYNAGFGQFSQEDASPLYGWMPDLRAVVESRLPAFFTQSNNTSALEGETAVMAHVLGAKFVLLPTQNPFVASIAQDGCRSPSRSCANHSFYAIQGCDKARRNGADVDLSSHSGRQALRSAVNEALRLGADIATLQQMTTRLDSNPKPERPHRGKRGRSERDIGRDDEALMDSPLSGERPGARFAPKEGKSSPPLPVPDYRLEVSQGDGVIKATVELPLLESARDVDLEVLKGQLWVAAEGKYGTLKVTLPSPVVEDTVIAKFDRKRRELELTLQVQRPASDGSET